VPKWCPGISLSNSGLSAVFDIQMHYGEVAACLLTGPRTLRLLFISKVKLAVKGHHFESTEDIQRAAT